MAQAGLAKEGTQLWGCLFLPGLLGSGDLLEPVSRVAPANAEHPPEALGRIDAGEPRGAAGALLR